MKEQVIGIQVMHSKVVLPAIDAARLALAEQVRTHEEMEAKLEPGQSTLSFNPYVQTPGMADVPRTADDFRFWELSDEESFSTFTLRISL